MALLASRTVSAPDPRREKPAGSRLPYARHVDDATIETRDGRLLQFIHLGGFPFETADTDELNYRKTVRETVLRGVANSRFALYHHIVRRETTPQLSGEFTDPFSRDLTRNGGRGSIVANSTPTTFF
jgi:type IV secretion system protein VirB4